MPTSLRAWTLPRRQAPRMCGRLAAAMPTIHLMGGTIMGTDGGNSVVNSYGQTHEIPNLYVAGPGIFATSGASNPTYTIFALSLRGAEQLAARLGHGCRLTGGILREDDGRNRAAAHLWLLHPSAPPSPRRSKSLRHAANTGSNVPQLLDEVVHVGLRPGVAAIPEIEQGVLVQRDPFNNARGHPADDPCRQAVGDHHRLVRDRDGKTGLGSSRPQKYLTRGPCAPIAVEIKIVPSIPVWAAVRFAISAIMSSDSSSAKSAIGRHRRCVDLGHRVSSSDPRGNASAPG